MSPSWCHWMRIIIRDTNILYGLGEGICTVSKLYRGWGYEDLLVEMGIQCR